MAAPLKHPPLKHYLDESAVRRLAHELRCASPVFPEDAFVDACLAGLAERELAARAAFIADALHAFLPRPFGAAVKVILAALGPQAASDGSGLGTLCYWPYAAFIQRHGVDDCGDFAPAMHAQHEITKRFSAEFSIRVFLEKYPEKTWAQLLAWTADDSVHVRRLVSEGTRPRLPWAPRLRFFQRDPAPVLALLDRLKDDPERYVQRSVANSLNDIAKDHPDLVVDVCRNWQIGASPARLWIVGHALRSLVKKGHRGALQTLGVGGDPQVSIDEVRIEPRRIDVGDKMRFSFTLRNTGRQSQTLLVDYAVHFVKANGTSRPKVFKLRKLVLAPGSSVELSAGVSFAPMSTRRHYPGRHKIDALINGVAFPLAGFDVSISRRVRNVG